MRNGMHEERPDGRQRRFRPLYREPDRGGGRTARAKSTWSSARAGWSGRGPDVDAGFDDPEMSQHHLRIEFSRGRFHAIDLDSTNGTRVNGVGIESAELAHGDRIEAGGHVFQILIERREQCSWPWSAGGDVPRIQ